jgi:acyl carrier protein
MLDPDSAPRPQPAPDLIAELEWLYEQVKKRHRDIRVEDRFQEDLGVDSLAAVELLVAAEDRFGVQLLAHPRIASVRTVGDLVGLIESGLGATERAPA